MAGFKYTPLQHNEIRLLRPTSNGEISFELVHRYLQIKPRYCALPYTWGAPIFSQKIVLDGQQFNITQNLHDAHRRLTNGHGGKPRLIAKRDSSGLMPFASTRATQQSVASRCAWWGSFTNRRRRYMSGLENLRTPCKMSLPSRRWMDSLKCCSALLWRTTPIGLGGCRKRHHDGKMTSTGGNWKFFQEAKMFLMPRVPQCEDLSYLSFTTCVPWSTPEWETRRKSLWPAIRAA